MTYFGNNQSAVSIINNSQNVSLASGTNILNNALNTIPFVSNGEKFPFISNSIMLNITSIKGDGDVNNTLGKITIDNNKSITSNVGTTFSPQYSLSSNNCSSMIIGNGLLSTMNYSVNDTEDQSLAGFFNNINIMLKD